MVASWIYNNVSVFYHIFLPWFGIGFWCSHWGSFEGKFEIEGKSEGKFENRSPPKTNFLMVEWNHGSILYQMIQNSPSPDHLFSHSNSFSKNVHQRSVRQEPQWDAEFSPDPGKLRLDHTLNLQPCAGKGMDGNWRYRSQNGASSKVKA
jgi:hypothetical protein